jgi:hypothetical protein
MNFEDTQKHLEVFSQCNLTTKGEQNNLEFKLVPKPSSTPTSFLVFTSSPNSQSGI